MDANTRLENYLLQKDMERKEHEPLKQNEFYASQAGMCPRKIQYEKKHKTPNSPSTLKKFLVGNLIHDYIQKNIYSDYKAEERYDLEFEDIHIRMRVDLENDKEVIEVKSIKKLPKAPLDHHVKQCAIYMKQTGKTGKVLYIEKESGNLAEFTIPKEDANVAFMESVDDFKSVMFADEQSVDVDPRRSWECNWCNNKECPYNKG